MIRKLLLAAWAICTMTSVQAQGQRPDLSTVDPVEVSVTNLNVVNPPEVLAAYAKRHAGEAPVRKTNGRLSAPLSAKQSPLRAAADTVQYFAAGQSHHKNYIFNVNGGDISTWNIGVVRNGNEVTFKGLFDLASRTTSWQVCTDELVTGTFDESAKTVTIPCSTLFDDATVVGYVGSYTITVISGDVSETGMMTPDDKLVFNADVDDDGNITRLTAAKVIALPEYYGTTNYGNLLVYRGLVITLQPEGAEVYTFNDYVDLGEAFPEVSVTNSIQVVNLGQTAASYVVDVESDPENYVLSPTGAGELAPGSVATIEFELNGSDVADLVEANGLISYEGGGNEGELMVNLEGKIIPYPDFSPVVKNGDFTFKTNIECPFEVYTDDEGTTWARSGNHGYAAISDFYVYFNVPEGQIGTLSWDGMYKNDPSFRYYWSNYAGYFIDTDLQSSYSTYIQDAFTGALEFAPGDHYVRFQHQTSYYSGYADDGLYIKDLALDFDALEADKALLKTDEVRFGNFILDEGSTVSGTAYVEIQNRGTNDLAVTGVSTDNDEFNAVQTVETAKTLEVLSVPVEFLASTSGDKTGNITIETTGGTYTIPVVAKVIDQPDFSSVITEGAEYITVTTNPNHPFIVEDGVAYNLDWDQPDLEASQYGDYTEMVVKFDIPEGKVGYISWDGQVWGNPLDNVGWTHYYGDYASFDFVHSPLSGYGYQNSGSKYGFASEVENEAGPADSYTVFGSDESWAGYLTNIPGSHTFSFRYIHNGDGITYGKNRLEVSNIRLHVIDFAEHNAELLTEGTITFDSTYVGYNRYTTATVQLKNTGSQTLSIESITAVGDDTSFYGIVPEGYNNEAAFDKTLSATLWFYPGVYPEKDSLIVDELLIRTNAGDFTVPVQGVAKSSVGILMVGDFEDDAYGWSTYDADGDGRTWQLGTSLWYETPEYCHSGKQALGSVSGSSYDGDLQPDNWTFSYAIDVPEEGAVLTWYTAAHHHDRYAEHYSVYVEESFDDASQLSSLTPVFSETLPAESADEWQYHAVDLADYAGKTVYVAFRHHETVGQYVLKLDDVFVYTKEKYNEIDAINNAIASNEGNVVSRQYYNAAGQVVNAPESGLNIVRMVNGDGSVVTKKFVIK